MGVVSTVEFSAFMREVGRRKVFTKAEEQRVARRVHDPDPAVRNEARRLMAEHNMRLVVSICKPYARMGFAMEDLFQEGCVGLMKAVEKFAPEKGYKFSTYATWWIKQAVHRYMAGAGGNTIRTPGWLLRHRRLLHKRMTEHDETPEEAGEALEMTPEQVLEAIQGPRATVSIDAAVRDDGGDEGRHAMIPDPNAPDPAEMLAESHVALRAAMGELSPRQRKILELRFGFEGPVKGRNEVAKQLGLGNRVVQQEQKEALGLLRRILSKERLTAAGMDEADAELTAVFQAFEEMDADEAAEQPDGPTCRLAS